MLAILIGVVLPLGAIIGGSVYGYFPEKRFLYKVGLIIPLVAGMTMVVMWAISY